jgi:hypothetical protein
MSRTGNSGKTTIFDSIPVLILIGILAGAMGGLGIGLVTGRASSSAEAAPSTAQRPSK